MCRSVHRMTFPITDEINETIKGFRRALRAAPARAVIGEDPERTFELWYEVDKEQETLVDVRIHVEGTGHPIGHDGSYVSTMSTAGGQLIWHVYVECSLA